MRGVRLVFRCPRMFHVLEVVDDPSNGLDEGELRECVLADVRDNLDSTAVRSQVPLRACRLVPVPELFGVLD